MSDILRIFLAAVAVFRLAQLFSWDYGPFHIFERLRLFLGKRAAGKIGGLDHTIAELINCPYCLGIWFALLLSPFCLFPTLVGDWFILVVGLAGIQAFMQSVIPDRH